MAYEAQKESLKNRKGGKINFGIIELLIPIVTTQMIYQSSDISILNKVEEILKQTTPDDVKYYGKFRKLAISVSKKFIETDLYNSSNLYHYYQIDKNELENSIHKEYVTKFQRVKEVYMILENNYKNGNLLDTTIIAYNKILEKCDFYYGLAADYICVALYLFLFNHSDAIIV